MQDVSKDSTDDSKDVSDLINLDDSLSLSISDFDPLNEKPSSSLPTVIKSFENPIYPYFNPTNLPTTNQNPTASKPDDIELLKSYELDKFGVTGKQATTTSANNSGVVRKATFDDIFEDRFGDNLTNNAKTDHVNSKNWTKFD